MVRFLGSKVNRGAGGGSGGGGSTKMQEFTRTTGISTDGDNNVTQVVYGDTTYSNVGYNTVGLITGFTEKIGEKEVNWRCSYNSANLITHIEDLETAPNVSLASTATIVHEGYHLLFDATTTNVPAGSTLYYSVIDNATSGLSTDFAVSERTGSFTLVGIAGTFQVIPQEDTEVEPADSFKVYIYDDSGRTHQIGQSVAIGITDSISLPAQTPIYATFGQSYYITNNNDTWNGVRIHRAYSNNYSFNASETPTDDNWGSYVTESASGGDKWYIGANWGGSAIPSRWNQKHGIYTYQKAQSPGGGHSFEFGNTATAGPHTSRFYSVRGSSTQVSGTSAGIVTTNYNDFEFDATTWTNEYGDGFASFYADSNSSNHKYPDIINTITSNSPNWNPDGHGSGDSDGGMILWKPPKPTKEVMLVYANHHSNDCCNITCWDNNNGSVKWQARYGKPSSFSRGGNVVNENYTRTIIAEHTDGFVYINSDHGGTVAGAFYYMYR